MSGQDTPSLSDKAFVSAGNVKNVRLAICNTHRTIRFHETKIFVEYVRNIIRHIFYAVLVLTFNYHTWNHCTPCHSWSLGAWAFYLWCWYLFDELIDAGQSNSFSSQCVVDLPFPLQLDIELSEREMMSTIWVHPVTGETLLQTSPQGFPGPLLYLVQSFLEKKNIYLLTKNLTLQTLTGRLKKPCLNKAMVGWSLAWRIDRP